jgi:predicted AAA+ superfamily ATPase
MILRPKYIEKIMAYLDAPFVKILSGIRRSGKSTIMKMIVGVLQTRGIGDAQILQYSFDSMRYEHIETAKQLFDEVTAKLVSGQKSYLFFDEIQEVKDWEKALNSLMTDCNVDIYVTGSNSRMMSSELSTYLTGRYVTFRVFPLSFEEYLAFRKVQIQENPGILNGSGNGDGSGYGCGTMDFSDFLKHFMYSEFARYLHYGGFPAIHLREYTIDEAYTIIRDIYNSTIFTDIVNRNEIRRVDQLERIVRFAFDNIGRTFSAAAISKYLKSEKRSIDNETVYLELNL